MAYVAPYIDSTGLHLPTYDDILASLIASAQSIYGTNIYLDEDSADYQFLSAIALKIYDTLQSVQLSYSSRSPVTAIGVGLDDILKLNGLTRTASSHSTVTVTLTGTSGTVIANGVVSDANEYKWDLPASVTIGSGGTVDAIATCETAGAIAALAGEITTIETPTKNWTSVTNVDSATSGSDQEADSHVRARQAVSVEAPSQTLLDGTRAAIAALTDVTRYKVFENYTNSPDTDPNSLNLPAHSITCIVEGDTDENVANAIYLNRGIGCYTNGTTTVVVTNSVTDADTNISFYRPTYIPIYASLYVHPMDGFTSSTITNLQTAIKNYLNSLQIGNTVTVSGVEAAAMSIVPDISRPPFSITYLGIGISTSTIGTDDVIIGFNGLASGSTAHVTVAEV